MTSMFHLIDCFNATLLVSFLFNTKSKEIREILSLRLAVPKAATAPRTAADVEAVKAKERARLASTALPPSRDRAAKAAKPTPKASPAPVKPGTVPLLGIHIATL